MNKKTFESKLGNIKIEYIINDDSALMEYINYDPQYVKLFLITLKESIEELKKMKINSVFQKVLHDDWNTFLKKNTTWSVIEKRDEYYLISTKIDNIYKNILEGFGIFEDHTQYKSDF